MDIRRGHVTTKLLNSISWTLTKLCTKGKYCTLNFMMTNRRSKQFNLSQTLMDNEASLFLWKPNQQVKGQKSTKEITADTWDCVTYGQICASLLAWIPVKYDPHSVYRSVHIYHWHQTIIHTWMFNLLYYTDASHMLRGVKKQGCTSHINVNKQQPSIILWLSLYINCTYFFLKLYKPELWFWSKQMLSNSYVQMSPLFTILLLSLWYWCAFLLGFKSVNGYSGHASEV